MNISPYRFLAATPVWQTGKEREMNLTLAFEATVPAHKDAVLALACSTIYTVFVNGAFLACGPARAPHGYHRVDLLPLGDRLTEEVNTVSIRVTGANINSFSHVDHPAFLCAEIVSDSKPVVCTGDGFTAYSYPARVQRVPRYTDQRLFGEVYRLPNHPEPVPVSVVETGVFLLRDTPYPTYEPIPFQQVTAAGEFEITDREVRTPIYITDAVHREELGKFKFPCIGYTPAELETVPVITAQKMAFTAGHALLPPVSAVPLSAGRFADMVLGINMTGILSLTVHCRQDTVLYLLFDEILSADGQLDVLRMQACNVMVWELKAGEYTLTAAEPYTMRYLRAACVSGECVIENPFLRRVGFPPVDRRLNSDDPQLQAVFDAAVETFRQNTLDIYMDCPSRERAGWLCDSFFTSRAEYTLTGKSVVERSFLTNFLLAEQVPYIPEGMLPMCYPSDFLRPRFIPNWAMWYVLELEEYQKRSGDRAFIESARPRMMKLLSYFRRFENELGLLENLESWVFVEWSEANKFVQDVNFPTNMLYARTKRALATLYGLPELAEEARRLEETVRSLSQDGLFFCDNAVRTDGKLVLSGEHSETCQYYAFFTGIATPATHPVLWQTMLEAFGPERTGAYPEVYSSNTFIGHYLRLELLSVYGCTEQLLENLKGYFYKMAQRTGTLWENDTPKASCCHGFTSAILYWLDRCGKLI